MMIVLMHVTVIVFAPFADDTSTNAAWAAVVNTLWPFHLSTLALLSGMLGARRVRQGVSATAATLTRTAYLYVVWSAVYVLLRTLGVDTWAKPLSMLDIAIGEITAPRTVLWFLLGLVFWTFALAAVHKWPPWLVLTMCAAASIGSYWLPGSRDHDQYI
ncbi:hypothetical protein N4R40_06410 [Microbacterium sp. PMIC_1C1B]|uniref:Acyltransferase 3 domain-containing protein n=1 Tax=Microbacterium memoriense TaxID=2978350 RepID=A0ABT2PBL2_9MICO|nr:hypothetical protein [Microbacterium memoriense]